MDVPVEILSSTGFFEYFERDPTRIERPGLPFLAYILGHIFYLLNFNIINLNFNMKNPSDQECRGR